MQRVVLLVRHPLDAIWSEYQRRQTGGNSHTEQVYVRAQWSERNRLYTDQQESKQTYNSDSYRLLRLFLCFLGTFLSHNFFLSLLLAPIGPLLTCLSAHVCICALVYFFLAPSSSLCAGVASVGPRFRRVRYMYGLQMAAAFAQTCALGFQSVGPLPYHGYEATLKQEEQQAWRHSRASPAVRSFLLHSMCFALTCFVLK